MRLETAVQREPKHGRWGPSKDLQECTPGPFWTRSKLEQQKHTPWTQLGIVLLGFQVMIPSVELDSQAPHPLQRSILVGAEQYPVNQYATTEREQSAKSQQC